MRFPIARLCAVRIMLWSACAIVSKYVKVGRAKVTILHGMLGFGFGLFDCD